MTRWSVVGRRSSLPRPAVPRVTLRGLTVGVALIFVNCCFQFYAEPMRQVWVTNATPFANVIFLLFLLTALNAALRRFLSGVALGSADLIAVYVMLSIQTGLSSAHTLHWLMGAITYGPWGATPNNRWASEYLPHLPAWLMVTDDEALKGYYLGHSTFFTARHVRAWLVPLVWWTLFFYLLCAVLASVAILFSRQWIRKERLSFPIVELTFQMVSEGTPFWRQRLMWLGFALAAGAELTNGLNYLFPAVPLLPIRRINIGPMFTEVPWNALDETNISFYPFIIGLSFLIPLDLSMSLWVFYLIHKAQLVFGAVVGWRDIPLYPFAYNQQFGAGAAIIMVALWGSRDHLRRVWRVAWGRRPTGGDTETRRRGDAERSDRPVSASPRLRVSASSPLVVGRSSFVEEVDPDERRQYRRALVTIAVGTALIPAFIVAAGLPWWIAFFVYAMYVFMGLVVSRIRCELGFPMHQMPRMNGPSLLMLADGAQNLGTKNITVLGLFHMFTVNNLGHPLPHQFEGLKLADREGMTNDERRTTNDHQGMTNDQCPMSNEPAAPIGHWTLDIGHSPVVGRSSGSFGGLIRAMTVAILVAVPATFLIYLAGTYHFGAASAHLRLGLSGRQMYEQFLPMWAHSDAYREPNFLALGVTAGSFVVAYLLMVLRLRFLGWPLHPLGMAVANGSHDLGDVVCGVFVASIVKGAVLHYSGLKGYRAAVPFFLGLMLGDLVMGMTWVAGGILFNTPTYVFFL